MRKPTQREVDDFIKYRSLHVALVQKLGEICFDMNFSNHDSDKINAIGKELDLFVMRNASKDNKLHLSKEDKNELRKVSAKHAKSQKHHAEYWDSSITIRNFKADDTNIIVAKSMPKRYLAEMACDWSACALYHNEPILDWYNKVIDDTLFLTVNQKKYLLECLEKIEKIVLKNNIKFPENEYDCKQVEPLKEEEGACVAASNFEGMTPEKVNKIVEPLEESGSRNMFWNSYITYVPELEIRESLKSIEDAYDVVNSYHVKDDLGETLDNYIVINEEKVSIETYSKYFEEEWKLWVEKIGPILKEERDTFTIYRGFKNSEINLNRLGNCWTVDKEAAKYFGNNIITGKTDVYNVDKIATLFLGVANIFKDEYEVRLWTDKTIELK